MFLLQMSDNTVDVIQKLGFPAFIAIIALWFIYQVWKYVIKKLDEKDLQINDTITSHKDFRDRLLTTQNKIIDTQHDIKEILLRGK